MRIQQRILRPNYWRNAMSLSAHDCDLDARAFAAWMRQARAAWMRQARAASTATEPTAILDIDTDPGTPHSATVRQNQVR